MVCVQIAPAMEWKMASMPMNTTTIDSTGALLNGRSSTRSTSSPVTKDNAAAISSAGQKPMPV